MKLIKVRLRDNMQIQVEEKGIIEVKTNQYNLKHLDNIFFILICHITYWVWDNWWMVDFQLYLMIIHALSKIKNLDYGKCIHDTAKDIFTWCLKCWMYALIITQKNKFNLWYL